MIFQPIIPIILILFVSILVIGFSTFILISNRKNPSLFKRWILRCLALLMIPLMMLRPGVAEEKETEVFTNQYDIFFVVDTTSSMIAEDWEPDILSNRLSAVKQDISRLVDEYSGSRYGLITFNSSAYVQAPLTKDSSALMSSVKNMLPEITRNSAGSEVRIAEKLLNKTLTETAETNPDRARLVFFFSDGEETADIPSGNAQPFNNISNLISGGAVYGYGTEQGGKMPIQSGYYISNDKGYIQDPSTGADALSKIDEANLKALSEELQVPYYHRDYKTPVQVEELEINLAPELINTKTVNDYTSLIAILFVMLLSVNLGLTLASLKRLKVGANNA